MNKFLLFLAAVLFSTTFFTACETIDKVSNIDDVNFEYDGEFAIPLVNSTINLQDIITNLDSTTTLVIGEDDLIHFNYKGKLLSKGSDDIFANIPNFPFPVLDTFVEFPYTIPTDLTVEYLIFKSGFINFYYESNHTEDVQVIIELPEVTNENGEVYQSITNVTYNGSVPNSGLGYMDLTGWRLTPDAGGKIHVRYIATTPDGTRVTLDNFFLQFDQFEASYLQGYLGQEVYDIERDTILIDFFDFWVSGGVFFEDPTVTLTVDNSFGFPASSLTNIMRVTTVDGSTIDLESAALVEGINIDYPALNEVGEAKRTIFVFDKTNSNIQDLFANKPVLVDYDMDGLANPEGDNSIIGFATDSSFFNVQVEVDMPLHANNNFFTVQNTRDFNFADLSAVDYLEFKILTENEIPVDIYLQMYFEDENGQVLDSLFDFDLPGDERNRIAEAAPTDPTGVSISSKYKETFARLESDKLHRISTATSIRYITIFDNEGTSGVKVLANDDFTLKIGVKTGIDTE